MVGWTIKAVYDGMGLRKGEFRVGKIQLCDVRREAGCMMVYLNATTERYNMLIHIVIRQKNTSFQLPWAPQKFGYQWRSSVTNNNTG